MEDVIKNGEYAAAGVIFVDRESGSEDKTMCYPVTMVTLFDMNDLEHVRGRVFKVVDGRWVEQQ